MKKMGLCLALFALLLSLSGCAGVESALHEAGEKIQSNRVETPQNNGGDIDWSFVPVVREKAVSLFTEAFPEAKVQGNRRSLQEHEGRPGDRDHQLRAERQKRRLRV